MSLLKQVLRKKVDTTMRTKSQLLFVLGLISRYLELFPNCDKTQISALYNLLKEMVGETGCEVVVKNFDESLVKSSIEWVMPDLLDSVVEAPQWSEKLKEFDWRPMFGLPPLCPTPINWYHPGNQCERLAEHPTEILHNDNYRNCTCRKSLTIERRKPVTKPNFRGFSHLVLLALR